MKPSRKTLKKKADKLWADLIKAVGHCEAEGYEFRCNGVLQAAHLVPRRYLSVRWNTLNGVALCGAHHLWFTHHPLEWEDWIAEHVPLGVYNELRREAKEAGGPPDYDKVLGELVREELGA